MAKRDEQGREPDLWYRVLLPHGAVGPGKVQLMRCIAETGSVSASARRLKMSHKRSVALVGEINSLGFGTIIETRAGGEAGGGARLTERGAELLARYDELDRAVRDAAAEPLARLAALHASD